MPVALAAALLAGCQREEITVYSVPRETHTAAPAGGTGHGSPLKWVLPAGWKETQGSAMRVASFEVAGADGAKADVSVMALPPSDEVMNVNRWRGELGLGPVDADQVAQAGQTVAVGDAQGRLFDIAGEKPSPNKDVVERTLAAMAEHDGQMWFFKMRGEKALVAAEKERFIGFLKAVDFHGGEGADHGEPAGSASGGAGAARPAAASPQWRVPEGWEPEKPGAMVLVAFRADDALITVSPPFGGDFGGLLPNVNRWRGQVGLPAVEESDLPKLLGKLDLGGTEAIVADMTGKDMESGRGTRQIVTVVSHAGQTWFYKIRGSEESVAAQKGAFETFVKSAKYPQ